MVKRKSVAVISEGPGVTTFEVDTGGVIVFGADESSGVNIVSELDRRRIRTTPTITTRTTTVSKIAKTVTGIASSSWHHLTTVLAAGAICRSLHVDNIVR